ncbi:MAG: hypothetical protein MK212_08430 [Saprospiraceae bacterium]|nr:hypothetical protein [Saprospiraceae bacterium]
MISFTLWESLDLKQRVFPAISSLESFSFDLGNLGNPLLIYGLIISLIATSLLNFKKYTIPFCLFLVTILVLQDLLRLQVWVYLYSCILLWLYITYYRKQKETAVEDHSYKVPLKGIAIILASVYIWSGINKVNIHYDTSVFPWLMKISDWTKPFAESTLLARGSAIAEILLGLLLCFKKTQKGSAYSIIIFHGVILYLLVSDGWNHVVYPWNVAMVLMVLVVFTRKDNDNAITQQIKWIHYPVIFLFTLAPTLHFFNAWPYNLSLTMYSGMPLEAEMIFDDTGHECLDTGYEPEMGFHSDTETSLNIADLSTLFLEIPAFAEEFYYRRVAKHYCKCLGAHKMYLQLERKHRFAKQAAKRKITCKQLLRN